MKIKWYAWGYIFDCDSFIYNDKKITGLMYSVKVNKDTPIRYNPIIIQLTKENGFTIQLKSTAKSFIVQPYKFYFLAQCSDLSEEPIEIDHNTLMQYSNYFIDAYNSSAESSWLLNKC